MSKSVSSTIMQNSLSREYLLAFLIWLQKTKHGSGDGKQSKERPEMLNPPTFASSLLFLVHLYPIR